MPRPSLPLFKVTRVKHSLEPDYQASLGSMLYSMQNNASIDRVESGLHTVTAQLPVLPHKTILSKIQITLVQELDVCMLMFVVDGGGEADRRI